jgi:hypothetical protein
VSHRLQISLPLWSTVLAVALTAYSVLKPPRHGATGRELAIELVIVLAIAAATFAWVGRARAAGRGAVVLSALGLVSVALFALGIFSVVLAAGGALLALEARRRGQTTAATAAFVLAALTLPLSVLIAVVS